MRNLKKLASLLLALVMVLSLTVTAYAAPTTGSITLKDATNVPVAGKTFKAYQILELKLVDGTEATGHVYTVPEKMVSFFEDEFDLDADDVDFDYKATVALGGLKDNSDELFAFAKRALAAAKLAGVTPVAKTGETGKSSVVFENLPLGYYVIEDEGSAEPISALILDSTNPDVDVNIKADKPSLDKDIDGDTDTDPNTEDLVKYNNTSIGDKVPYVLTSKVPDMTGYTKYFFVVTDTMTQGLTFGNDVKIKIGDTELAADKYTVTATPKGEEGVDGTEIKIVLKDFINYKDQKGKDITITYSATVNEKAIIGEDGNPNSATLKYSNNPNVTPSGGDEPTSTDPVGETPKQETYTYITEIELLKTDDGGNELTGAEFTLEGTRANKVIVIKEVYVMDNTNGTYYKLLDGTYTETAPDDTNRTHYVVPTDKYKLTTVKETQTVTDTVKATATVDDHGKLVFSGLAAGEYTITEIKAPDGYNRLDKPIKLTIGWTEPADGETECTWTYTWTSENEEGSTSAGTNSNQLTVVNKTGVELPSTGGMGTTLFYIAGGILVLAAVVLLVTKKRMQNAE